MALCGEDHPKLVARLNRIEGQVRGLKKMVEEDRDCLQVLKQNKDHIILPIILLNLFRWCLERKQFT